jgi:hypothetical protein
VAVAAGEEVAAVAAEAAPGEDPWFRRSVQAGIVAITLCVFCLPAALSTSPHGRNLAHIPPWSYRWDPVLGTSLRWALIWGGLTLVAGLIGYLVERQFRRPALPSAPLRYAPPEGIGPVQGAVAYLGTFDDGAVAATVMHLANLGLVCVEDDGARLVVRGLQEESAWQAVDEVSLAFARRLGILFKNQTFDLRSTAADDRARLRAAVAEMAKAVRAWALRFGLIRSHKLQSLTLLSVLALGFIGFFLTFVVHLAQPWLFGLPLWAYAVMAGPILGRWGVGLTFTRVGAGVRQELAGFRRVLATASADDRGEFARRNDLYFRYLPWALVLGCAEEWKTTSEVVFGASLEPDWLDGLTLQSLVTETRLIEQAATAPRETA